MVGVTLNWAVRAAAHPDMRLISLRSVLSAASSAPLMTELTPPLPPSTTLEIAGLTLPTDFVPPSYELCLGAQDAAGRRYDRRYTPTLEFLLACKAHRVRTAGWLGAWAAEGSAAARRPQRSIFGFAALREHRLFDP